METTKIIIPEVFEESVRELTIYFDKDGDMVLAYDENDEITVSYSMFKEAMKCLDKLNQHI